MDDLPDAIEFAFTLRPDPDPQIGQYVLAFDGLVYISELWVEPDFRGRGVGTALLYRLGATIDLAHCLIALKALPLRADHAQISTADEIDRVKRFYAKNGFAQAQGEYAIKDARLCEAIKKRLAARRPA
jgi:GNAT superfamily N-acetyltransferase